MRPIAVVVPVAKAFDPRHTLLVWLTLSVAFVIAARERWALSVRVRYDSPEGWRTYSPDIFLDFSREPNRSYSR